MRKYIFVCCVILVPFFLFAQSKKIPDDFLKDSMPVLIEKAKDLLARIYDSKIIGSYGYGPWLGRFSRKAVPI